MRFSEVLISKDTEPMDDLVILVSWKLIEIQVLARSYQICSSRTVPDTKC